MYNFRRFVTFIYHLYLKLRDINTFLWKWAPDFQEVMGQRTQIIEVSETKGRQWLFSGKRSRFWREKSCVPVAVICCLLYLWRDANFISMITISNTSLFLCCLKLSNFQIKKELLMMQFYQTQKRVCWDRNLLTEKSFQKEQEQEISLFHGVPLI